MVNSSGSYDNAYNRHLANIIQDYDSNAMYSNPPTMILHGGMRQKHKDGQNLFVIYYQKK